VTNIPRGDDTADDKTLIANKYAHNLSHTGHVNDHIRSFLYDTLEKPIASNYEAELQGQDKTFDSERYNAQCASALERNAELIPRTNQWYAEMGYGRYMYEKDREELIAALTAKKEAEEAARTAALAAENEEATS